MAIVLDLIIHVVVYVGGMGSVVVTSAWHTGGPDSIPRQGRLRTFG